MPPGRRNRLGVHLLLCAGLAIGGGNAGCARVNATGDFQRTGEMIGEHTGVEPPAPPPDHNQVEACLDGLLADGLSVDHAVRIALINNHEFASLFQEIGVSRADLVQSTLLTNPSLSLISRLPEGGGRANLELAIGQELVDLWQIPVRKKIAKAELEQTMLRVAQRAVALAAEVKTRYYSVLAAGMAEATARESLELVQRSLSSVERQQRAGEISQLEVDLQRLTVLDAELALIAAERERRVAEAELARVLGLNRAGRRLALTGELPRPAVLPDERELLALARKQRLDARMAEYAVRAAESEVLREYLRVFPSIIAGFDVERMEKRALPSRKVLADTARESIAAGQLTAPAIESRGQRRRARSEIIDAILGPTLQVTLPIWDQNQAQIAKARFKLLQRQLDYENLLDTVALEVERASAVLRSAARLMGVYEEQAIPQVNATVGRAQQVFQSGEQGILVLIEAQRSLVTRRAAFVDVRRSYAVALAELEAAVGGCLPSASSQPAAASAPAEHQ